MSMNHANKRFQHNIILVEKSYKDSSDNSAESSYIYTWPVKIKYFLGLSRLMAAALFPVFMFKTG